jgi:hypothetical protein
MVITFKWCCCLRLENVESAVSSTVVEDRAEGEARAALGLADAVAQIRARWVVPRQNIAHPWNQRDAAKLKLTCSDKIFAP